MVGGRLECCLLGPFPRRCQINVRSRDSTGPQSQSAPPTASAVLDHGLGRNCGYRRGGDRRFGRGSYTPALTRFVRRTADNDRVTVVENSARTTQVGGVTRKGFLPGQSGNPGGRPKGLARRVRDIVGDDGSEIVSFMYEVMTDPKARMADRLEAGSWLANRGFGRAVQPVDLDVNQPLALNVSDFSTEDLELLIAIFEKYAPNVGEIAESGEIPISRPAIESPSSRQR
jgi:hypothetical protein